MNEELDFTQLSDADESEDLFTNSEESQGETPPEKNGDKIEKTTEVNAEDLFAKPEGVGSNEDKNQAMEGTSSEGDSTPPNKSFYSSIAPALKEDGILQNLDEESLKKIVTPEDFAEAFEKEIQSRLDEKQKRIDEALNAGIEPDEIKRYESTLQVVESITSDQLKDESDKGENLRRQLIYQDYINKGFSTERAKKQMEKSFSAGTDIEDATEALQGNKEFFSKGYEDLINEAKEYSKKEEEDKRLQSERIKKNILEGDVFKGMELDNSVKLKAFNAISKPVYKDNEGNWYTEIQKYEMDNKEDFLSKLGLIFAATNGFKDLSKLVNKEVKKQTKHSLRELEHTLSNTAYTPSGTLDYASGQDDGQSKIGWDIDVS